MSLRDPGNRRAIALFSGAAVLIIGGTLWYARHSLAGVHGDLDLELIFFRLFVSQDAPAAWLQAALLLVALPASLLLPRARIERGLLWLGTHEGFVAFLIFAALALLAPLVYQGYPLALDEYSPLFQSKIFASGHLYGKYPPELVTRLLPIPGEFIRYSPVTGQTIESNWPAFALLLTPFTFLNVPWLLNTMAGAVTVLLIAHVARRLLPEQPLAPGWAMLLAIASPVIAIDALSYYSMSLHLVVALAFTALLMDPTPKRAFAAGLVGGLGLCLNNPIPHALYALPWIIWLLWRRDRWPNLLLLGLGYLPAALLGGGWLYVQSRLPQLPPSGIVAQAHATTFLTRLIQELHNGALHLPDSVAWKAHALWFAKLYLWAVPGLPVIALFGWATVRTDARARALAASALLTAFVYVVFVNLDQGHGWGARYFHSFWAIFPLFGAAWLTRDPVGARWSRYFAALSLGGLLLLVPQRMRQVHGFIAEARSQTPAHDPTRSQMIFVIKHKGEGRYYAWDAIRNDPFLSEITIILDSQDFSRDSQLVMDLYPGARLVSKTNHGTVWDLPSR